MQTRKKKTKRLPVAMSWPDDKVKVSDEEFARWVETHSLEKLIGTAERMPIESPPGSVLEETKHKREVFERMLMALHISREDLQAMRRLAREKNVPYSVLLRSWIREGLKREQRRAAG